MRWWSSVEWHGAVFMGALYLRCSALSHLPPGGAENSWSAELECYSKSLDSLLRGRTEQFGGSQTVHSLWSKIVTKCKRFWVESLQCQMVQVRVSQCPNGGWTTDHSSEKNAYALSIRLTFRTFKIFSRKYFGKLGTSHQNVSDIIST
jgi:hypothetical protein